MVKIALNRTTEPKKDRKMLEGAQGSTGLFSPVMQMGFAAICVVLIVLLAWTINKLLQLYQLSNDRFMEQNERTNSVLCNLNEIINRMEDTQKKGVRTSEELVRELMRRPCIATPEDVSRRYTHSHSPTRIVSDEEAKEARDRINRQAGNT